MPILDLPGVHAASEESSHPAFVSRQVSQARRYYLNLSPAPSPGVTVVCGGCERVRGDYVVEREDFPFLALEFVAEGDGTLELAGREYRLQPGIAFAYGPRARHRIVGDGARPMLKYYVDFMGDSAEKALRATPLKSWRAVQLSSSREVLELFELLQREGQSGSAFAPQICAAIIPLLLLKISERAIAPGQGEPRALATYERAKEWIEQNCRTASRVEDAAAACGVDVAYLCRLFQRFGHGTPYRLLMRSKMAIAAELLVDHGQLVKEVADTLHFSDPFHFSRAFKRIYGLSPQAFVRQSRAPRRRTDALTH